MPNNNQLRAWNSKIRVQGSRLVLGLAVAAFGTTPVAQTQTFTILHSFTGTAGDGSQPSASPILDGAGNLYGNTLLAGSSNHGIVYEWVKATGQENVLHTFAGPPTDGQLPQGVLVRDAHGTLFGATSFGGTSSDGTVFRVSRAGQESLVYSFLGPPADANSPNAGLVEDAAGILYGTSYGGGVNSLGTVFSVNSRTGQEKVLHSFTGGSDGAKPGTALFQDAHGSLYGTSGNAVFKLSRRQGGGWRFSMFYIFGNSQNDGAGPNSALIQDSARNFYGTTVAGGAHGAGTVYRIDPTGVETVLYSFGGNSGDGKTPSGNLVRDAAGEIYGTTMSGGSSGLGTVFRLASDGTETVLHNFSGSDGRIPNGVVMDPAGNLYGIATVGGDFGFGTLFELTP